MRAQILIVALLIAVSGCAMLSQPARTAVNYDRCKRAWRISFPDVALELNERICGLELKITRVRILAINYIPAGWSMAVDAGYADRPSISGNAGHGTGCLLSTDELREFVTVCDPSSMPESGELPFAIEGTLVTTTDFEATRHRTFTMDDLIMQEASRATPLQSGGGERSLFWRN